MPAHSCPIHSVHAIPPVAALRMGLRLAPPEGGLRPQVPRPIGPGAARAVTLVPARAAPGVRAGGWAGLPGPLGELRALRALGCGRVTVRVVSAGGRNRA